MQEFFSARIISLFILMLRKMQGFGSRQLLLYERNHFPLLAVSCIATHKMISNKRFSSGSTYLTQGSSERRRRSTCHDFLPEWFSQKTHTCRQQTGCQSSFSSGCCLCTPSVLTHPSPCIWLCMIWVRREWKGLGVYLTGSVFVLNCLFFPLSVSLTDTLQHTLQQVPPGSPRGNFAHLDCRVNPGDEDRLSRHDPDTDVPSLVLRWVWSTHT